MIDPLAELENVTQHRPKVVDGKIDIVGTLRTVLRGDPGVILVEPVKEAATLKMMLEAHGKPYSWYLMEGAGHSFTNSEWLDMARTLSLFVDDYLHPSTIDVDEPPEN